MDKDLLELFDEGIYLGYLIVNKTNGKIIKYSKNLNNLFKIDERGITNLKEIIWIGDIERFEHYIQSLTKEYKSPIEIELYMQDSTYRKLSINAKYDERESNQVIILLSQNYSLYQNEIDRLIQSRNLLKEFSSLFNGIYLSMDSNFKINKIFGNIIELTGYNENELIQEVQYFDKLVADGDKEIFKYFHNLSSLGQTLKSIEYKIITKEQKTLWVNEEFKFSRGDDNSFVIQCLLTNIERRREAENELKKSREQIERLANHLEMVREEERKEFAREIHDEIGHSLTALKLDINLLLKKRFLREDALEKKLNEMMVSIEQTIKTLQRISSQLRPSILDHFGLVAAIEWQAKEFQKQTGLRCKYLIPEDDIELSEHKSIAIFRVFQEALTNIARHSKATRVDVSLEVVDNNIELKVSDNGVGIKKEVIDDPNSLGLLGMRERVNLIGGKISISSVLNLGTTILINVPIN
ncbi:MAG TPA: sensor histidine kinase [Candidatus Kapabacteria bacterium]|jgi:two-component system sensor histidine kinase UhpB|nr:sensor histidine kinase [Candidatus Kapabacteria bacterium]